MSAFNELRKHAREKRDQVISKARDDYAETLTRIAALEQGILGREVSSHRTGTSCINQVIPSDRTFTTLDVLAGLEALVPGRNWRKRGIDSQIQRLRAQGLVRRIKRANGYEPAIYAKIGVEVAVIPYQDKTLPQVVREVLKARQPLRQTDLAVAMLESGYQTAMSPKALRDAVGVVLRKGRYKLVDGKWSVVEGRKRDRLRVSRG